MSGRLVEPCVPGTACGQANTLATAAMNNRRLIRSLRRRWRAVCPARFEPERLGGPEVDHPAPTWSADDRQTRWLLALEDSAKVEKRHSCHKALYSSSLRPPSRSAQEDARRPGILGQVVPFRLDLDADHELRCRYRRHSARQQNPQTHDSESLRSKGRNGQKADHGLHRPIAAQEVAMTLVHASSRTGAPMSQLLNFGEIVAMNAYLSPDKIGARDLSRSLTFRRWNERACRLANAHGP
jgi:hypothetical protein